MKKALCLLLALLMAVSMLAGCDSRNEGTNTQQPEENTQPPEESAQQPSEAETADSPVLPVTEEAAYEGVQSYCERAFGWDGKAEEGSAWLAMGTGTDSEYQVIFRSYTGALVYFYVEKASGNTRVVEYVPALNTEHEAGSFNLFDPPEKEDLPELSSEGGAASHSEGEEKSESHYVFQPKVCSVYMEEVFGDTMCETWFHLVDAVMAGENPFACPDQHTYDWVMGQFPERCFPVLTELIDYAYDREHSVVDGVASFTWLVPPEEAAVRIAEFAEQIEGILNDALEDDYSDLEKALALYDYFSTHYEYDYDTYERMYQEYVEDVKSITFFNEGIGVCQEISTAYSYLLMQVGVEATTMAGIDHQWSYVRIGGHNYHIDPTFAISIKGSLAYFMMNDEQREVTGYGRDTHRITSNYSQDHPHPNYVADDDTFRPLWDQDYAGFDHEKKIIYCPIGEDANGEWSYYEFDYTGY